MNTEQYFLQHARIEANFEQMLTRKVLRGISLTGNSSHHVYPVETYCDNVGAPIGRRGAGAVAGRYSPAVKGHRNIELRLVRHDHAGAQMKACKKRARDIFFILGFC